MSYEKELQELDLDPTLQRDDELPAPYTPSPWQRKFHLLKTNEALGAGSGGPGKSVCLKWDPWNIAILEHARCSNPRHPYPLKWGKSKARALYLRRNTGMMDQMIAQCKMEFPQADPSIAWSEKHQQFTFASGMKYQFGHCVQRDDYVIYQSKEFCVTNGTRIRMGDKSLKRIEEIIKGDFVMTLEGPRVVLRSFSTGEKPCLVARIEDGTEGIKVEKISASCPIMVAPHSMFGLSWDGSTRKSIYMNSTGFCGWRSYEFLLRRISLTTEEEKELFPAFVHTMILSVPVTLYGKPGYDSLAKKYLHYYTGVPTKITEGVHHGIAHLESADMEQTWDLEVADANHYITEFGLVSSNCAVNFDELTQFDKGQYDGICSRVRVSDPILNRFKKVRAMSNPLIGAEDQMRGIKVLDPHWVRKRFVDPAPEGNKILKFKVKLLDGTEEWRTRIYLPAKLHDNPDKEFVRQYEASLLALPEHIRKAMLDGDWYHVPGSFFGQHWDSSIHVCKPFAIPSDWKRFRSMDWGFKTYGCVLWWAIDPDGNAFVEREYTFKGMGAEAVANACKEWESFQGLSKSGKSTLTGPADTQLWEKRDISLSKAEIFARNGVRWVPADKKSRQNNAYLLISRLRDKSGGIPGITFFENCRKCISTIPSIPTDPDNREQPMDTREDHWLDAVLYGVAYMSRRPRGVAEDDQVTFGPKANKIATPSRGRFGYW